MDDTYLGIIMFLVVIYAFFTMFMIISGFETQKQSKITLAGLAVIAMFTIGIFWESNRQLLTVLAYLLPLYFLYNVMQILGNCTHKRLLLHVVNVLVAGLITILIIL